MKALCCFETSGTTYQTTLHNIAAVGNIYL